MNNLITKFDLLNTLGSCIFLTLFACKKTPAPPVTPRPPAPITALEFTVFKSTKIDSIYFRFNNHVTHSTYYFYHKDSFVYVYYHYDTINYLNYIIKKFGNQYNIFCEKSTNGYWAKPSANYFYYKNGETTPYASNFFLFNTAQDSFIKGTSECTFNNGNLTKKVETTGNSGIYSKIGNSYSYGTMELDWFLQLLLPMNEKHIICKNLIATDYPFYEGYVNPNKITQEFIYTYETQKYANSTYLNILKSLGDVKTEVEKWNIKIIYK